MRRKSIKNLKQKLPLAFPINLLIRMYLGRKFHKLHKMRVSFFLATAQRFKNPTQPMPQNIRECIINYLNQKRKIALSSLISGHESAQYLNRTLPWLSHNNIKFQTLPWASNPAFGQGDYAVSYNVI